MHQRLVTPIAIVAVLAALAACTQRTDGSASGSGSATPSTPGSSSSAAGQVQPYRIGRVSFRDCSSALRDNGITGSGRAKGKLSLGCADVQVPLDYTRPDGTKISITMIKVHDSANTNPIGSLLLNPGGPGGSGVLFTLGEIDSLPDTLFEHFDIVGFDPRGVGLSTPITCVSDREKDVLFAASPDMATASGFATAKAQAVTFNSGCVKNMGDKLPFFNTINTARDMDVLRQGLGDSKMNYLGFSYGTELGSVYAHLFPQNVRVAVLDGAVDPLTNGIQQFADQLKGFELAFDQFSAYCPTSSGCQSLTNPRAVAEQIEQTALATPLTTGHSRKLTFSLAATGILQALYSKSLWPDLASALIAAKSGDGSKLLALADQYTERHSDGSYTNIADANTAISCNDTAPGPTDEQIKATTTSWTTQFPIFGKWAAISLFSCQQWQPSRTVPPKPNAATATKVLVIGNLHDPATPYQGAKDLTTTMGNAELLSWDGEGHTSYLQGSSCVDDYVNAYLVNLTLPPANTTCPK